MKKSPTKTKKTPATATAADTKFAPVVRAFSKNKQVVVGGRFGAKSLKVNGKTFAMLVKGKFVAKLPPARVAQLLAGGGVQRFDPGHGRLMKEWVALAGKPKQWIGLAKEAYAFVNGEQS